MAHIFRDPKNGQISEAQCGRILDVNYDMGFQHCLLQHFFNLFSILDMFTSMDMWS